MGSKVDREDFFFDFIYYLCYNIYIRQKEGKYGRLCMAYDWAIVFDNHNNSTTF